MNVNPSQSDLKCYEILLPAMPASRNKVIYGYWLLSSDLCKTSWIFVHGPVCHRTGPVLSRNVIRLSWDVVRFVLKRGTFCLVRFVHGPFCPSSMVPCQGRSKSINNIKWWVLPKLRIFFKAENPTGHVYRNACRIFKATWLPTITRTFVKS